MVAIDCVFVSYYEGVYCFERSNALLGIPLSWIYLPCQYSFWLNKLGDGR
jgi:hypothetical protein